MNKPEAIHLQEMPYTKKYRSGGSETLRIQKSDSSSSLASDSHGLPTCSHTKYYSFIQCRLLERNK